MNKLFLCAVLLIGCFSPDLSKAMLLCDELDSGCPPGFFCFIRNNNKVGMCVDTIKLNDPTVDLSGGIIITDMMQQTDINMSVIDMRILPDLSIPPSTCKAGGGTHIGDGIYACQGTWAYGGASALCNGGKVCTSLTLSQRSTCDNINGFYLISAGGSVDMLGSTFECLSFTAGRTLVFYGCGKSGSVATSPCNGAQGYLSCSPTGNFNCTTDVSSIVSTVSSGPQRGVLCCP